MFRIVDRKLLKAPRWVICSIAFRSVHLNNDKKKPLSFAHIYVANTKKNLADEEKKKAQKQKSLKDFFFEYEGFD